MCSPKCVLRLRIFDFLVLFSFGEMAFLLMGVYQESRSHGTVWPSSEAGIDSAQHDYGIFRRHYMDLVMNNVLLCYFCMIQTSARAT